MNDTINQLISGAMVMAYFVAGTFFFRFWKSTCDRLFLIFGCAFYLLGIQRLMLALDTGTFEDTTTLYIVRLIAFILILIAIIDKNRARRREP